MYNFPTNDRWQVWSSYWPDYWALKTPKVKYQLDLMSEHPSVPSRRCTMGSRHRIFKRRKSKRRWAEIPPMAWDDGVEQDSTEGSSRSATHSWHNRSNQQTQVHSCSDSYQVFWGKSPKSGIMFNPLKLLVILVCIQPRCNANSLQ